MNTRYAVRFHSRESDRLLCSVAPNPSYMASHKGKKLIDVLAAGETPAVVYPVSVVDSVLIHAGMESAGPSRQSIQAAAGEPEEFWRKQTGESIPSFKRTCLRQAA